jgi:small subunit ribosomal protein S20
VAWRKELFIVANHKSSIKRARQSQERRLRNRMVKTRVKNVTKAVRAAVVEKAQDAPDQLKTAQSMIAKAAKKGVIHKRSAARKISRLARQVNTIAN